MTSAPRSDRIDAAAGAGLIAGEFEDADAVEGEHGWGSLG